MGVNATGTLGGCRSSAEYENRGAVGGEWVGSGERLYTERIADENDSDLRYSEVPLKGKNKTLVKMLGGRQHRKTPAGQNIGGRIPAALTPMWPGYQLYGATHCAGPPHCTALAHWTFSSPTLHVARTRLPSVGSGADPGSWQSACR